MVFKQYTLNSKRRISNSKCHVIQCKQMHENFCSLCLNANSCITSESDTECGKLNMNPCIIELMMYDVGKSENLKELGP